MAKGRELSHRVDWKEFKMHHKGLLLPTGQIVSAQQILAGMAVLEIQSDLEIRTSTFEFEVLTLGKSD